MSPSDTEDNRLKPLLLEYERLKAEQVARIGFRDNLLYVALGATGAVAAFALGKHHEAAWFLVPVVGVTLGWTYLANDTKISGIGDYVHRDLRRRVAAVAGSSELFGWEESPIKTARRPNKKAIQLLVDLLAFIFPGLLAPAAFMLERHRSPWWAIAIGVTTWAVVLRVGAEIIRESDIDSIQDLKPLFTDWHLKRQEQGMKDRARPALTVDIAALVMPQEEVLLIQRAKDPFAGQWALPGGFVEDEETTQDAARRELQEETGIVAHDLRLVGVYDTPGRDPRGWAVSIAFVTVLSNQPDVHGASDAADARWFSVAALPELAFDHKDILNAAIDVARRR